MKNLKLIATLALSMAFAFASFGADEKKPARGKGNNVIAKLGLDADQKKVFMAAQKESGDARKGLKDVTDRKERAAKMKEINTKLQAKLKEILKPEQLEKYTAARAEMAKNRKAAGAGGEARGKGKGKGKKKE